MNFNYLYIFTLRIMKLFNLLVLLLLICGVFTTVYAENVNRSFYYFAKSNHTSKLTYVKTQIRNVSVIPTTTVCPDSSYNAVSLDDVLSQGNAFTPYVNNYF